MALGRTQRDLLIFAALLLAPALVCAVAYAVLPAFREFMHRVVYDVLEWYRKNVWNAF